MLKLFWLGNHTPHGPVPSTNTSSTTDQPSPSNRSPLSVPGRKAMFRIVNMILFMSATAMKSFGFLAELAAIKAGCVPLAAVVVLIVELLAKSVGFNTDHIGGLSPNRTRDTASPLVALINGIWSIAV